MYMYNKGILHLKLTQNVAGQDVQIIEDESNGQPEPRKRKRRLTRILGRKINCSILQVVV